MYHSSTQRRFWTFANAEEMLSHRKAAHRRFISERLEKRDCSAILDFIASLTNQRKFLEKPLHPENPKVLALFFTLEEEEELRRLYGAMLLDFCQKFNKTTTLLYKSTIATAFALFHRAYINESVMRLHPKHMMITCLWMAIKIDEVHMTMEQFVAPLRGDRQKAMDIILSCEPYVMKKLHYHLLIHHPHRAFEGLLIHLKTRYSHHTNQPEALRALGDKFLTSALETEALLLYAPSQIALAALMEAAEESGQDLTLYITQVLVHAPIDTPITESGNSMERAEELEEEREAGQGSKNSIHLIATCQEIRRLVRHSASRPVTRERGKQLEAKIETCRDPAFNPETQLYQSRISEALKSEMEQDAKFD